MAVEPTDSITVPPRVEGPHGRAWLCDLAEGHRRMPDEPPSASLAHWVVEAPWAHPLWHSYSIVVLHLRPMADGRETLIYLDDATHELWVYALNPDVDRNELIATGIVGRKQWMTPGNFSAQFIEVADELAERRVRDVVVAICAGSLSPDTDYTGQWIKLFGNNMMKDRDNPKPPRRR